MPLPAAKLPATSETEHLRILLEKQPSCLMRVGVDGVMLALNEAALSLLDSPDLASLLGRSISERLGEEHVAQWSEFAGRVWNDGAGSLECRLADRAGALRTVLLQAIALREHHDGIDSLLVSARDVTGSRELERTLETSEGQLAVLNSVRAELAAALAREQVLVARVSEAEAECEDRAALLKQSETAREQIEAHHLKERAPLQRLAEEQQLALLEQQRKFRDAVNILRAELSRATTEQQALRAANATLLEDQTRALSDQQQQLLVAQERSHHESLDGLRAELTQATSEQQALRMANETLIADQARSASEQQRLALEQERRHQESFTGLQMELAQAAAEQQALRTANETLIADQARTLSEQQQLALVEQERRHQEIVSALQGEVAQAIAAHQELRTSNEALIADQARTLSEQQQLALVEQERRHQETVSALQFEVAQAIAVQHELRISNEMLIADQARTLSEQQQLALVEQERRHAELVGSLEGHLAQAIAAQATLRSESESVIAEQARALTAGQAAAVDRERLHGELETTWQAQLAQTAAEHEALRAANETLIAAQAQALIEQQQQATQAIERVQRELVDGLQVQLARAAAEHDALRATNEAVIAEQTRLLGEHGAARAELERALAQARTQADSQLLQQNQVLEEFQHQLATVLADRDGLAALVERGEAARSEFDAELARARADAYLVRQQLDDLVKRHEQRHEETAHLLQRLANAEHESKRLNELHEQQEVRTAELRAHVTGAQADNKRLQMLLAESEAHQMRLTADYAAERLKARREIAEAIVEHDRVMKTLVDDNVELRHLRDSARILESLAATGRLAREIGGELRDAIAQLNAHSTSLLTLTPLEAAHRDGVEALRLDALRAAALARQLLQSDTRLPVSTSEGVLDIVK